MAVISPSETLVTSYKTAWRHNVENISYKLQVFENEVLRKILGSYKDEKVEKLRHYLTRNFMVSFEALTATSMKMTVACDIAPCSLIDIDRRLRDTFCLYRRCDRCWSISTRRHCAISHKTDIVQKLNFYVARALIDFLLDYLTTLFQIKRSQCYERDGKIITSRE